MSLAVVGGTVVDIILPRTPRLPSWPRHSEFSPDNLVLLAEAPLVTLGGNGANAAYTAACGGAAVALHTRLGQDAFGTVARGWLEEAGCRLASGRPARRTAVNVTAANARHERATFFYPGEAPLLPKPATLRGTTHLLVCGWPHPTPRTTAALFRAARRQGVFTALDAGPFLGAPWTIAGLAPLLPHLDLFLTNEYELAALTGTDISQGAAALRALRKEFHGHLVVKRGAKGAFWFPTRSDRRHSVAPSRVRAVNTVGAGDSFNGALLAALVHGKPFPQALATAARTAARVVASEKGIVGLRRA